MTPPTRCILRKRECCPLAFHPWPARQSHHPRLTAENRGHFNDFCDDCVLIKGGQSRDQVGFILCSCGPKGSDIRTEYAYDLSEFSRPGVFGITASANQTSSGLQPSLSMSPNTVAFNVRAPQNTVANLFLPFKWRPRTMSWPTSPPGPIRRSAKNKRSR